MLTNIIFLSQNEFKDVLKKSFIRVKNSTFKAEI